MSRFANPKALRPPGAPNGKPQPFSPRGNKVFQPAGNPTQTVAVRTSAKSAEDSWWKAEAESPIRRIGLLFLVLYLVVRFGYISDLLGALYGRAYLVLILGSITALLAILGGGIQRSFRAKPIYLMTALMVWMCIVTPFGIWRSGSLGVLIQAFETEFSMMFLIAGLALTLSDVRKVFSAISLGAIFVIIVSFRYGVEEFGRFSFQFGTLGNANDYATHLLVLIPFLLFMASTSKSMIGRIVGGVAIVLGLYLVFKTGSRAGLLALAASTGLLLLKATVTQRLAGLTVGGVVFAIGLMTIPSTTWMRYLMIVDSEVAEESNDAGLQMAEGSTYGRITLLKDSLTLTAMNPLFGIGPGNFTPGAADLAAERGERGMWLLSHNTYTEISSETGIPGLVLLIVLQITLFQSLARTRQLAKHHPQGEWISQAAFCLMLMLTNYSICIFFASLSYKFYLPAIVALVSALEFATRQTLSNGKTRDASAASFRVPAYATTQPARILS